MESVEVVYTEGAARVLREMGSEMEKGFQEHVEKFATATVWRQEDIAQHLGKTLRGQWGGGCSFSAIAALDREVKLLIITALQRR
jgi:hypothetical protein